MFEISKQFWFEAAHTLEREVETDSSRRIHGHSYRAEVMLRGVRCTGLSKVTVYRDSSRDTVSYYGPSAA